MPADREVTPGRRDFLAALLAVPLAPLARRPAYERPSIRKATPRAEWSDPERWHYLRGAWWRR